MQIVILGMLGSWHVQRLLEAGRSLGHSVRLVEFQRLTAELGAECSTLQVDGFDLLLADRVLVRGVPSGSLERIVLRMDALHRLQLAGVGVLNPPAAIETCVDKYLATARLQSAGLPVPRTAVCEGVEESLAAFDWLGGDVVVKPLFGSEGRGIVRVQCQAIAHRVFRSLFEMGSVLYLQEFVPHPGYDVRALVLGERVLAAMKRSSALDFRTNVARGAKPESCDLPREWSNLAMEAARTIGAPLAGVDLLPNSKGEPLIVEVNSNPGFRALCETTSKNIAAEIMSFLVESPLGIG